MPTWAFAEGRQREFRYAALAQGLDVVRKALGHYEIAVVQTSAYRPGADHVVHPVGPFLRGMGVLVLAGLRHERDLGTGESGALTLARRYALFTLVGIAAEDDLDAPDLPGGLATPPMPQNAQPVNAIGSGGISAVRLTPGAPPAAREALGRRPLPPTMTSGDLARQLAAELEAITGLRALTDWTGG